MLISTNPATGADIAQFRLDNADDVQKAVERARIAAEWWSALRFSERRRRLIRWRSLIAQRADELTELIHSENGKPVSDALIEVLGAVHHLDWAAKHAKRTLRRRRVPSGILMLNHSATVEYLPLGVVGVIGPWNYPVFTPMGSIAYALAAGNAVVFKPSEFTPAVGRWLVDCFAEVVPEQPVLQALFGFGDTGAALCRSGVEKLAFTGSSATGKKVMSACAETLTPVLIECGGKDAAIVAADADLDRAAESILWGGMSNSGQTCIGTERVYVASEVYEEFLTKLTARAEKLVTGEQYGPMTMPSQIDVVSRHIDEALNAGGRAILGGRDSIRAPYVAPTILVDVPDDNAAMQEETFGPTLIIRRVKDVNEAIMLTNNTDYGLAGAVFARRGGRAIARRMNSGMISVNSVLSFAGVAALPFGGVGTSGFGRIHGAEGLREFTRPHSVTVQRFQLPFALYSFDRSTQINSLLRRLTRLLYGRSGL